MCVCVVVCVRVWLCVWLRLFNVCVVVCVCVCALRLFSVPLLLLTDGACDWVTMGGGSHFECLRHAACL